MIKAGVRTAMITARVVPAPSSPPRVVAAQRALTATLPTPWVLAQAARYAAPPAPAGPAGPQPPPQAATVPTTITSRNRVEDRVPYAGVTDELAKAWELVQAGDLPGVMRHLRLNAEKLAISDIAKVVEQAAAQAGFDDLVAASSALAADPDQPQNLFDFGYGCIERGISYLAVPALTAALDRVPDSPVVLTELVAALEDEGRHRDAVAVLTERGAALRAWPDRYLLVFNSIMAGDLAGAKAQFGQLTAPDDEQWQPAYERVWRMLDRAATVGTVSVLDNRDLRGWHFVLTGGVLATLSPYGFDQGMTGRYAYTQDGYDRCLLGLLRARVILAATGRRPRTVSLLPDRSSQALGLAAAEVFGLRPEPFSARRQDTLVVAYDLTAAGDELMAQLRERTDGQVLYEHATCWTDPPTVTADISTVLHQTVVAPWGEHLRHTASGPPQPAPADDRSVRELAAEITRADPTPDSGDGETPADLDDTLTRFAAGVAGSWLTGPRGRASASPGPVPSSRFL